MTRRDDAIQAGDKFNAYVKKGPFSKRLDGTEGVGQLSICCPEKAISVDDSKITTKKCIYYRHMFYFEKVNSG